MIAAFFYEVFETAKSGALSLRCVRPWANVLIRWWSAFNSACMHWSNHVGEIIETISTEWLLRRDCYAGRTTAGQGSGDSVAYSEKGHSSYSTVKLRAYG